MSQDFFLLNRAHQIARLCKTAIDIPATNGRKALPALAEFQQLLHRICDIGGLQASAQLDTRQQSDLRAFEKLVVQHRFSSDTRIKQPAVEVIRAIFADADYFSGLKPLPQYTDAFAYELLFPSWLNLLTATMLPQAATGKPKLSGAHQGALFEFLSSVAADSQEQDRQLTGLATLIASRFDAPKCGQHLQRLLDLYQRQGELILRTLEQIQEASRDARQFTAWLDAWLTVTYSCQRWESASSVQVCDGRPAVRALPPGLQRQLLELEETGKDWQAYFAIAVPLGRLVESQRLLCPQYSQLLEQAPQQVAALLELLAPTTDDVLSEESQLGLACLCKQLLAGQPSDWATVAAAFRARIAPSLTGFNESTITFFCRQFVEDTPRRQLLVASCQSEAPARKLAAAILQNAAKVDDASRFMNLLSCAVIVSPDAEQQQARHALQALDAVVGNRSIGSKELSDLVQDLQSNPEQALGWLASPIMACGGKSPRLAALYLTLNDISETYRLAGKVGNFSVVRAKYSALTS